MAVFGITDLRAFADMLTDPGVDLDGAEILSALTKAGISNGTSGESRAEELFLALRRKQDDAGNRRAILAFLRVIVDPSKYYDREGKFESLRTQLNDQLLLCGLQIRPDGSLARWEAEELDKDQKRAMGWLAKATGFGSIFGR